MMKKVGIIGFGWLGARIAEILKSKYEITATVRSEKKAQKLRSLGWSVSPADFPEDRIITVQAHLEISVCDAILITVPFSERRHGPTVMQNKMTNIAHFIGDFSGPVFIMSSTGIYPDITKQMTEEEVAVSDAFSENLFKNWFPQGSVLRLGGLMGDQRLLKNYSVAQENQIVNHIHYQDVAGILNLLLEKEVYNKLYNMVAPMHPTKAEVIAAQYGKSWQQKNQKNRVGKEISSEKLIQETHYKFAYPDPCLFHK